MQRIFRFRDALQKKYILAQEAGNATLASIENPLDPYRQENGKPGMEHRKHLLISLRVDFRELLAAKFGRNFVTRIAPLPIVIAETGHH